MAFFVAVFSRMILDSVTVPVHWLMPFDDRAVERVPNQAAYSQGQLSLVLHWTFALELGICAFAGYLFVRNRRGVKASSRVAGPALAPDVDALG